MDGIGGLYREGRLRISGLVAGLSAEELDRPVPACAEWTVRELVAHFAGTCTDLLAGNLEGVTTKAWADAQVRERRDRSLARLVEEWSVAAGQLETAVDHLPERLGTLWVLDLTAHEHDLRGALGRAGQRGGQAMLMSTEFLVTEGLRRQLLAMDLGPLVVRTDAKSWSLGDGAQEEKAPASLRCSLFELFRALTGRRSPRQIAGFDWSVDPSPFVRAFEFGTFTTRATDLEE